jgi:membrane protein YdbS with pleckstrin-like domain
MNNKSVNSAAGGGISLSSLTFLVFLVLKLCNVIDWSWWWVTAPLWIPFAAVTAIFVVVVLFAVVIDCITALVDNRKNRRR